MRYLSTFLVPEGNTDVAFLSVVLQRSLDAICRELVPPPVEVAEVQRLVIEPGEHRFSAVITAAQEAFDSMSLLFYHYDGSADPSRETRKYWEPMSRAWEHIGNPRPLVKVVPVREMEAWALCDIDTVLKITGGRGGDNEVFEWNVLASESAEELSDPKRTLSDLVRRGRSRRRGRRSPHDYLPLLAEQIELAELESLPSYRSWKTETSSALRELGFFA